MAKHLLGDVTAEVACASDTQDDETAVPSPGASGDDMATDSKSGNKSGNNPVGSQGRWTD